MCIKLDFTQIPSGCLQFTKHTVPSTVYLACGDTPNPVTHTRSLAPASDSTSSDSSPPHSHASSHSPSDSSANTFSESDRAPETNVATEFPSSEETVENEELSFDLEFEYEHPPTPAPSGITDVAHQRLKQDGSSRTEGNQTHCPDANCKHIGVFAASRVDAACVVCGSEGEGEGGFEPSVVVLSREDDIVVRTLIEWFSE